MSCPQDDAVAPSIATLIRQHSSCFHQLLIDQEPEVRKAATLPIAVLVLDTCRAACYAGIDRWGCNSAAHESLAIGAPNKACRTTGVKDGGHSQAGRSVLQSKRRGAGKSGFSTLLIIGHGQSKNSRTSKITKSKIQIPTGHKILKLFKLTLRFMLYPNYIRNKPDNPTITFHNTLKGCHHWQPNSSKQS
jgi:hypothetical protein